MHPAWGRGTVTDNPTLILLGEGIYRRRVLTWPFSFSVPLSPRSAATMVVRRASVDSNLVVWPWKSFYELRGTPPAPPLLVGAQRRWGRLGTGPGHGAA